MVLGASPVTVTPCILSAPLLSVSRSLAPQTGPGRARGPGVGTSTHCASPHPPLVHFSGSSTRDKRASSKSK
ncbi:hypothetical protein AAFF_G00291190 [Aldrovandia affinis]|uniref:Uncharacterized protein n=1 Tax=Aldrovandia affinis TaxID=143900 RepID=A0AAD7R997_9TELE|nr:hypothetical protein AAFF_G00291190 [Aldrovandia affinis]